MINQFELFNADSFELLETLVHKVDVLVTDPPYLVHAGKGGGCFGNRDLLSIQEVSLMMVLIILFLIIS